MYGFRVALCRKKKFSLVGFAIQALESFNILITERRFYWLPFYHVSFYVESLDQWFDADTLKVYSLTNKQFQDKYITVESYDFEYIVPTETKRWLIDQVGRAYSYRAIAAIVRKMVRGWFGLKPVPFMNGDDSYICTEIVLKAMHKCGFDFTTDEIEISTIHETHKILERL